MQIPFTVESGFISQEELLSNVSKIKFPIVTNNKKISYYNIPAAFDIEVSSFYQHNEKKATMYVWQFGIFNYVTYGRTWDEFKAFISVLSEILHLSSELRLICYIHNFAYEFQFMRKHFEWDKIFFLEERKPVYGLVNGIEYRCSLKLSSKKLEKVGKDLNKYKVEKKVGDLDYNLIRTPTTPLTDEELGYCESDIRVLLSYIQEKIEEDGSILNIPLTNTGYVRRYCKKACYQKYTLYRNLMEELSIDADEYSQLKRAFAGGFTHASAKYSEQIIPDVGSFDFISSYPAVMLAEEFPLSKAKLIKHLDSVEEFYNLLKQKCCLIDVSFINLRPKLDYDHPISYSKTIKRRGVNVEVDNGRVVEAELLSLTCTEQDFFIYEQFYEWDDFVIHKMRVYDKSYLPTPFVKAIIGLYKKKTELKGVDGMEIEYMISKNMLNAAYGMAVTDIVRNEITYENDNFTTKKPDISEALDKYNNSRNRFLFYPWGVWVTAYARRNLFSGIKACGNDYIYSDTDSIKIKNPETHLDYINKYNSIMLKKLSRAAEFHKLDETDFSPRNLKGVAKTIGFWEYEGKYKRFKTIGAKRYFIEKYPEDVKEGELPYSLTVAGLNKASALEYIIKKYEDPMSALADGLKVPKQYSGRLTHTYFDEECNGIVRDYLGNVGKFSELSYIHMEQSEYELEISDEYREFLDLVTGRKEVII